MNIVFSFINGIFKVSVTVSIAHANILSLKLQLVSVWAMDVNDTLIAAC